MIKILITLSLAILGSCSPQNGEPSSTLSNSGMSEMERQMHNETIRTQGLDYPEF